MLPAQATWDVSERRNVVQRRSRRLHRFFDRRHGFDRRKSHTVLGTMRDRPWLLFLVLILLNLLSFIDGAFTAIEISLGIAVEGNPVLDAAARTHPLLAVAVKIGAMILVTLGIWHGRTLRAILALALLALALFGGIVAYHVGTLSGLGYL